MDSNNIGETEDRISELPDSLLHHILSFLHDIKHVARTMVLSKRWSGIWTSIPILQFPFWPLDKPLPSLSETKKFMAFVDRTLYFRDQNIQEIRFDANEYFDADRVHSWISIITKLKVKKLYLYLNLNQPFSIPLSLFTCQSLIKLHLDATDTTTQLPRSFSFPNLKKLTLNGIRFTDDCWNEQHFSCCPVLEKLELEECIWLGVQTFCISTPTLKRLVICSTDSVDDGLPNCALKIHAPNLVDLNYWGCVAKENVFSIFQKLKFASVDLRLRRGKQIGYGAAVSKFFQALSHVESLTVYPEVLEIMSIIDSFANILPTFHNLKELEVAPGETTDKSLFPLLKAAPNVTSLTFNECIDNNKKSILDWNALLSKSGCLLQHLKAFSFVDFSVKARQMRWVELILKNAETLESISLSSENVKNKEVIIRKLLSLPRASDRCKIEFEE